MSSEVDTAYLTRLNTALHESAAGSKQRKATTAPKMPTPPSQLSYKAMTPKAAPLPPSLSLRREGGHGRTDVQATTAASPAYSSRRASRASVFKSINADGHISKLSTPNGSEKGATDPANSPKRGSKPASTRTTPRGSKTNTPGGSKNPSPKAGQSPKGPSPKGGASPAGSHRSTPKNSSPAQP